MELFTETREIKDKKTKEVFEAIVSNWPANPVEVAGALDDEGKVKTLSAKYLYHFKKLEKLNKIQMKKLGNTYIAWPSDVEKIRVAHEILRDD
ncbi:MAG: hypothetical protein ABIJ92_03705 [Candidatus Aenigmatarchaeota archaeon]